MATSINNVVLTGYLGNDAKIGENGCTFLSLAISSYDKKEKKERLQWISIIKTNNNIDPYLKKGIRVEVVGYLIGGNEVIEKNFVNTLSVYATQIIISTPQNKNAGD